MSGLQERLDDAEWVLKNSGFRRCDIAACNCGSWHQVGGFKARFDEIKEAVEDAGHSMNGRTLLDSVAALVAERDALRVIVADLANELEIEIEQRYRDVKQHPAMAPKYERDMSSVHDARAALSPSHVEGK